MMTTSTRRAQDRLNTDPCPPPHGCQEARAHARFEVRDGRVGVEREEFPLPGSFVTVDRSLWSRLRGHAEGPLFDLKNLSRGGLCFETEQRFQAGERLTLSLLLKPWSEPARVRVEVRWTRAVYVDMLYEVGVQFLPFDDSRGGNSTAVGEAIAEIADAHGA
ncbi:MAG: PilZ domain-containing protein [Myxococcales bacterium]|jgi:hypothetical protein